MGLYCITGSTVSSVLKEANSRKIKKEEIVSIIINKPDGVYMIYER